MAYLSDYVLEIQLGLHLRCSARLEAALEASYTAAAWTLQISSGLDSSSQGSLVAHCRHRRACTIQGGASRGY